MTFRASANLCTGKIMLNLFGCNSCCTCKCEQDELSDSCQPASNLLTNNKPVLKTNNTPCEVGMATSWRVVHSYGVSPLPRLNHFITNNLGKRDGHDGTIHTWHLDMQEKVIQYCMKGDRFCENIGRQHKSNNIIWNCDLLSKMYWQSCFDPECKGFRGKCRHLPENIDSEIDAFIK